MTEAYFLRVMLLNISGRKPLCLYDVLLGSLVQGGKYTPCDVFGFAAPSDLGSKRV